MGENFLALVNTHEGDGVYENVAQIGLQDLHHWKTLLRYVKRVDLNNDCRSGSVQWTWCTLIKMKIMCGYM